MIVDNFTGRLQKSGLTGDLLPELDPIRSEWPAKPSMGFYYFAAGVAASLASFQTGGIPSGHLFRLKTLIIDNAQEAGKFVMYDGPGYSVTAFMFQLAESEGYFVGAEFLKGVCFQSIPMASISTASQIGVKIGGILHKRTSELG